jgi:NAD(P)-dependent dehydrogenase (short-subunit alcohol dehydrogenase family)
VRLAGKSIVVTGGAQGIGRACAELLGREGASVVVGDLREEGRDVADSICEAAGQPDPSRGRAVFRQADVTREDDCAALMRSAVEAFGRLDGLVNNVGWFPRASLEETTADLWHRVLDVNLTSAFFCSRHAAPHLRAAGGGSIVNIGSVHGIQGLPTLVAYSAAKGGLLSMTRTLAGALARDRIRVNYVVPGWILTETEIGVQRGLGVSEEQLRRQGGALPLGRHQTADDIAYAVLYLLSDESSQVTGATLNVDAGLSVLPQGAGESPLGQ